MPEKMIVEITAKDEHKLRELVRKIKEDKIADETDLIRLIEEHEFSTRNTTAYLRARLRAMLPYGLFEEEAPEFSLDQLKIFDAAMKTGIEVEVKHIGKRVPVQFHRMPTGAYTIADGLCEPHGISEDDDDL